MRDHTKLRAFELADAKLEGKRLAFTYKGSNYMPELRLDGGELLPAKPYLPALIINLIEKII